MVPWPLQQKDQNFWFLEITLFWNKCACCVCCTDRNSWPHDFFIFWFATATKNFDLIIWGVSTGRSNEKIKTFDFWKLHTLFWNKCAYCVLHTDRNSWPIYGQPDFCNMTLLLCLDGCQLIYEMYHKTSDNRSHKNGLSKVV